MQSGFSLIFGGDDFRPDEFLRDSIALVTLGATIVRKGQRTVSGTVPDHSAVEFYDVRNGTYPLDPVSEALDLLRSHRDEFLRLADFPGVSMRTLNIFGDSASCLLVISSSDLGFLHGFSLGISVSPWDRQG
jgi:hypothetical protein